MDYWEFSNGLELRAGSIKLSRNDSPPDYGQCSSCGRIGWMVLEFGKEYVYCTAHSTEYTHMRLSKNNQVVNCSSYYKKDQMDLHDMTKLATIIDIEKRQIGFGNGEGENIVTIKPPKEECGGDEGRNR
jgi:hypothetical protein